MQKPPDPKCDKCKGKGKYEPENGATALSYSIPLFSCPCTKKKPSEIIEERFQAVVEEGNALSSQQAFNQAICDFLDSAL